MAINNNEKLTTLGHLENVVKPYIDQNFIAKDKVGDGLNVDENGVLSADNASTNLGALASKDKVEKSDLTNDVQASIDKADTALQSFTETDPTVPAWAKTATKPKYTASEVGADETGSASSALSSAKAYTDEKTTDMATKTWVGQQGFKTIDNNTTYSLAAAAKNAANGNVGIKLTPNSGAADTVTVKGTGATTVTTDANGVIVVDSTDTNNLTYYGTCNTAAATAAKEVTCDNFELFTGAIIGVKFTNTNTATSCTLNVNNTGAKQIWYNTSVFTSKDGFVANKTNFYMYNGTYWVWLSGGVDSNTTYTNASLGQGYGTCVTEEATAAKVVTLGSYALSTGGIVSVKFTYAVPANATMNINNKGAKAIYYRGAAITEGIIQANDVAVFIYNGSQYHLISIDRWQEDIKAIKTTSDSAIQSIKIGTVTTGAAGSSASATATTSGTTTTLNLTIPKGDTGAAGSNGTNGTNGTTPTIKAAAGTNINTVGTPSVTASTSGTTTTFTFNNLKGEKGDKGDSGANATTTAVVSTSANGLAPKVTDENAFLRGDKTWNVPTYYGTCSTGSATAAKDVVCANFKLFTGAIIGVKFTNTNTVTTTCYLNVNNTGAKAISYQGTAYTLAPAIISGYAQKIIFYMYNGSNWIWLNTNDTLSPTAHLFSNPGDSNKLASCTDYWLLNNSYIQIIVPQDNTAQAALTLSINNKTSKPIYINGTVSSSSNYTLPKGSYLIYYDGTNYYFRTDGKITGSITGNAAAADKLNTNAGAANKPIYFSNGIPVAGSYELNKTVPSNAVFTDTNNKTAQTITTTDSDYRVLFSGTADDTTRTEGTRKAANFKFNPNTGSLTVPTVISDLNGNADTATQLTCGFGDEPWAARNFTYKNKDITSEVFKESNNTFWSSIADGSFTNLQLGNYFTKSIEVEDPFDSTVTLRKTLKIFIVGFNHFKVNDNRTLTGGGFITDDHIVCLITGLGTMKLNANTNATSGYQVSDIHSWLNTTFRSVLASEDCFGNHLVTKATLLSAKTSSNSTPTKGEFIEVSCALPAENQFTDTTMAPVAELGECGIFPLFRIISIQQLVTLNATSNDIKTRSNYESNKYVTLAANGTKKFGYDNNVGFILPYIILK